jgi:FkbH-like protein
VDHAFRFAVSATFTAEPVQPVIAFWGRQLNSDFETHFAPYNQLMQALLDPSGEFAVNHHGVNVLLARIEDLAGFDDHGPGSLTRLDANLQQLTSALRDAPARFNVPVILVLCPPSPAFIAEPARGAFVRDASIRLAAHLEDVPGLQFLSSEQISRLYPVEQIHSPEGDRLGRIPYTELYFAALGTAVVRLAHALFAPPYKVIALDCDNTLWQGICGEDGPTGVVIDAPRRALQQFMADQRDQGMLLAMASKNNEPDVIETFESNPAMPLQLRHFVTWRLNWESKATTLASIAEELSLGLDSIIFVDDNPKECAEVEDGLPEVLALALPENADEIPAFLNHVWAFDRPVVTEEDRNRNAYYSQSQEFGRELRRAASFADFMRSLDLHIRMEPLAPERLARVAQLTQRTNQFNFTTVRRTESEIQTLVREQGYECVTVEVSDRFGDYGIVGVVIYRELDASIDVDTFLLSCRALGRGVEHRMLAHLGQEAARRRLSFVRLNIAKTRKNLPAQQFMEEVGCDLVEYSGDSGTCEFPPTVLAGLEWRPGALLPATPPRPRKQIPATRKFVDFARIARTLARPELILDAMRRELSAHAYHSGMSEVEVKLALIWSELLHRPSIALSDNFFDLGGHSLLAVLLIMRVREAFGIELPIDDVYSGTLTLGELARKIEMYQLGDVDPNEYQTLLAEIENMSDEEVRRLLAEEDPGALTP